MDFFERLRADEIAAPFMIRVVGAERAVGARGVALGGLDLDDLGAVVGEHHGAVGTRQHRGEVEDAQAGEDALWFGVVCHGKTLGATWAGSLRVFVAGRRKIYSAGGAKTVLARLLSG